MKKRRIITLALCAMLAVGSMTTLTACGSSGTAVIEDANGQRTADMYKFLEENPSFNTAMKKGFASQTSDQMEISDIYIEDGNLATTVTYKIPIELTDETWNALQSAFATEGQVLAAQMKGAFSELTTATGYADAQIRVHYKSEDGKNLFDLILSADDVKLERT